MILGQSANYLLCIKQSDILFRLKPHLLDVVFFFTSLKIWRRDPECKIVCSGLLLLNFAMNAVVDFAIFIGIIASSPSDAIAVSYL